MSYIVTITSQGQISIPASIRRELGLNKKGKAVIKKEGDRVIIEPVADFMELKGVLRHRALKGKSIDEVVKIEEEAAGDGSHKV